MNRGSSNCDSLNREECLTRYFMELKGKALKLDEVLEYIENKDATINGVREILLDK